MENLIAKLMQRIKNAGPQARLSLQTHFVLSAQYFKNIGISSLYCEIRKLQIEIWISSFLEKSEALPALSP